MLSPSTILIAMLISTVSSSGHLQLVLTPSTNCAIRIITNILHAESYWLTMGEEWTTNIKPLHQQSAVKISFSVDGGAPEERIYEFRKAGVTHRDVFSFNDAAVLAEATFECDEGFTGSKCLKQITNTPRRMRSRTTTTTSTTPSTTTTTDVPREESGTVSINILLVLGLALIMNAVLITILIICFFTKRNQDVTTEPISTCESPDIKKKDISMDSGISTGSPRYTADPSTIIPISS